MESQITLASIVAFARAGALARAKAMFAEAGLERSHDPAVLSVKGRLLKDEALAARGPERKRLYREAARAYAGAGAATGASYPLINAATLSLLAGDRTQAERLARRILSSDADDAETPYWRSATHAEAQLLLGDVPRAGKSLASAIARAPEAYEDHASTLRQFGLILQTLNEDASWLDAFRPPRALHFAGHMAVGEARDRLQKEIRAAVEKERVGFAYGALAAGADIIIAEALLEARAELHVILPAPVHAFRDASVARRRGNWGKRFDAIMRRAASVRITDGSADPSSPLAVRLAAEVAMGSAAMQAQTLQTEAVQLLILERTRGKGTSASGAIGRAWKKSGRRQHILYTPRSHRAASRRSDPASEGLAAVLRIEFPNAERGAAQTRVLRTAARALTRSQKRVVAPRWTGEAIIAGFSAPAEAAHAALALIESFGNVPACRIGGTYGIAWLGRDPFDRKSLLSGSPVSEAREIIRSTPASAIHVGENFAAALLAGPAAAHPRVEFVGELPASSGDSPSRLYALMS